MGESGDQGPHERGWLSRYRWIAGVGALGLAALWIPDRSSPDLPLPDGKAFEWNRDKLFAALEKRFVEGRKEPCTYPLEEKLDQARLLFRRLEPALAQPNHEQWSEVEERFFEVMAAAGSCEKQLQLLLVHRDYMRKKVWSIAERWEPSQSARDRLYRLLYGFRVASEEVLLQMPEGKAPGFSLMHEEPSQTPAQVVEGVQLHSGDLLVSRGGAPTSAFIARGSDYPGNFSHVALVHIDEGSKEVSVIESHIESGVGISSVSDYLEDKKLRILVLRPRADLAAVQKNPQLPHQAATRALQAVRTRHIPYDFEMNVRDASRQFCSEVASSFYGELGIRLWGEPTRFSSPGLARWMSSLGVRHLETHGPSDLEYDPNLRVVAEWHDPEELFRDHIDNAVIDVMLQHAETGVDLDYSWGALPLARIAKGYSWVANLFGIVGPVPEGMSATVALRAQWLTSTHEKIAEDVRSRAAEFQKTQGYRPPYWRLVELARISARGELGP